jgi:DNA-binding transcriptional ArsR family regulator
MEEHFQLAVQLWAIGDEVRLRILQHLPFSKDCKHRNNVTALSEQLGIPQPTISHHLRILRQAGIVKKSKLCRDCYYWIDSKACSHVVERLRAVIAPEQSVVTES